MSRADDETTLRILDMHTRGQSLAVIARAVDMSKTAVHSRIRRVVTDDCLTDPDARRYWHKTPQGDLT